MTLLFVRHASVKKINNRDSLTDLGEKYVQKLPSLLKEKGYSNIDYIFYVSKSKSNVKINRCYETIKKISCQKIYEIKWNEYPIKDPKKYVGKTILICYIKSLLKKIPIEPYNQKDFYKEKGKTDLLYEEILVFNYKLSDYSFIEKIKTNDKAIDKLSNV